MARFTRLPVDTHPQNTAFLLRRGNGFSAKQFQALRDGGARRIVLAGLLATANRDLGWLELR